MKVPALVCVLLISHFITFSQQPQTNSRILPESEIEKILTDEVKKEFNIVFQIFKVFEYKDKAGKHYLVLTEKRHEEGEQIFHDSIKAFNFMVHGQKLMTEWTMTDYIKIEGNEVSEEASINFWSKYIEISDVDQDGLMEPILVYGTSGMNGTDDGRIKILTYYKGSKRAIRHQNGTLDLQRNTQVDKTFYELPEAIQDHVKNIMVRLAENNHAIFPAGWQAAMKNKKLKFDEN